MMSSHSHTDHATTDNHSHQHADASDRDSVRRMTLALVLLAVFMLVELTVGMVIHSLVLIADGIHMLSDVLALGLSLFAMSLAHKAPDEQRSYGYQRGQTLAAFVNGIVLFMLTIWIAVEAIERLITPGSVLGGPCYW